VYAPSAGVGNDEDDDEGGEDEGDDAAGGICGDNDAAAVAAGRCDDGGSVGDEDSSAGKSICSLLTVVEIEIREPGGPIGEKHPEFREKNTSGS